MILEKYKPGEEQGAAHAALDEMMRGVDEDKSYSHMIRLRLSGALAETCNDTYYVAHEDGRALARHWNGWGRHPDAIGNWGNFYTDEACRGRGIGGALLRFWAEDFASRDDLPLCFLCSAATPELTALYARLGFRTAIEGTDRGALYMPIGESPASFREFYTRYYQPSERIFHRRATVEYRHEIDCLLRFALRDLGEEFGIGDQKNAEALLLSAPESVGMLFTPDGHCVGWSFEGARQVYPIYERSTVIEEF